MNVAEEHTRTRAASTYYDKFGLIEIILNLHQRVSLLGVLLEGQRQEENGSECNANTYLTAH